MLEPFDDPQHGDLKRLSFNTILPVPPAEKTRVLAWFDDQRPAITQHPIGKGSAVFFLSSADNSWSSWTLSPLYLPLVQQMSAELLNLTGEGPIRYRTVGDLFWESTASRDQPTAAESGGGLSLVSFKGAESKDQGSAVSESSLNSSVLFDQVGFERRDNRLYVVNILAAESDPSRTSPESLAERYGLSLAADHGAVMQSTVSSTKRIEMWPWLAAGLILLLIAEVALSNLTAP